MNGGEDLKLFQELKDLSIPKTKDNLDSLLKKREIYDINPNTNYEMLAKALEINNNFEDIFLKYNQTLTFSQRKEIISRIEGTELEKSFIQRFGPLYKKSYVEQYFAFLKELKDYKKIKNKEKYKEIKQKYKINHYVDNKSIKIPLIYGTNELKYSSLLNNLYQILFAPKSMEKNGFFSHMSKRIFNDGKMEIENLSEKEIKEDEKRKFFYFNLTLKFAELYLEILCSDFMNFLK